MFEVSEKKKIVGGKMIFAPLGGYLLTQRFIKCALFGIFHINLLNVLLFILCSLVLLLFFERKK